MSLFLLLGVHLVAADVILYENDGPITPTTGNILTTIDFEAEMVFEMDIEVLADATSWESIFHCGNDNGIRQPGIWTHPDSDSAGSGWKGFHTVYSTVTNSNPHINPTSAFVFGTTYSFKMVITQSSLYVYVDDEEVYGNAAYAEHNLYTGQNCYAGDPWYGGAKVTITNLKICSGTECPSCVDAECNDGNICNGEEACVDNECVSPDDFSCPSNFVCNSGAGRCLRDCSLFAIDGYLTDCSDEFDTIQNEIAQLYDDRDDHLDRIVVLEEGLDAANEESVDHLDRIVVLETELAEAQVELIRVAGLVDGYAPNTELGEDSEAALGNPDSENVIPLMVNDFWLKAIGVLVILNIILFMIICCQYFRGRKSSKYDHVRQYSSVEEENVNLNK